MFEAKKKTLFAVDNSKSASKSAFIQAGLKTAAETTTGNGGKAYSSTGDPFVAQFGSPPPPREIRPPAAIA